MTRGSRSGGLRAGDTTFIDLAETNVGQGRAGAHYTFYYVDTFLLGTMIAPAMSRGDTVVGTDQPLLPLTVLTPGDHTLKMKVNAGGIVTESDTSDNAWQHTFHWDPGTITYSGHVRYRDMSKLNPDSVYPARGVRIEIWDHNDSGFDDSLGAVTTDNAGYFHFTSLTDIESDGSMRDIYFRVYAENAAAIVRDNHNGNEYRFVTPYAVNHPSGVFDTTLTVNDSLSGAFYIADQILRGEEYFKSKWPMPLGSVEVVWNKTDETHYWNGYIKISDSPNEAEWYPDTFDGDIILHEYGHRVDDLLHFFNLSSGGTHTWCGTYAPELAADEGWATCFSSMVRGNSYSRNCAHNFTRSFYVDAETGLEGYSPGSVVCNANSNGASCEGAVCGILWDIYDSHNDGRDTLSDCGYQMFQTLMGRIVNDHRPNNINEFLMAWQQDPSLDHRNAIRDIWVEHGIPLSCCWGTRGNIDGSYDDVVDMSDVFALLDFLGSGIPISDCAAENDANGDGVIDISDAFFLIDYLSGMVSLPACP